MGTSTSIPISIMGRLPDIESNISDSSSCIENEDEHKSRWTMHH
jgi:hypothetical protein